MARPRADCIDPEVTGCQCALEGSETVAVTGSGDPGDPFIPAAILDPDADNRIVESASGLAYFPSAGESRSENPARGILYRFTFGDELTPGVTETVDYENSDLAGGMTTDVAKTYLITPYAGFYLATFYVKFDVLGAGGDPAALTVRISDEDSDGEVAAFSGLMNGWPAGMTDAPPTIFSATSNVNLDAARRIRTQVKSNVIIGMAEGSDTSYTAKFSLVYLGPHI